MKMDPNSQIIKYPPPIKIEDVSMIFAHFKL